MKNETCPRAQYTGHGPLTVVARTDPALWDIVHRIVAGVDRRYDLHPKYEAIVRDYGEPEAQELIRDAVETRGACDIIQTKMSLGGEGMGLFGGLAENGQEFIFYEWTSTSPRLRIHITHQEARDIINGTKKEVRFWGCTKEHFQHREAEK